MAWTSQEWDAFFKNYCSLFNDKSISTLLVFCSWQQAGMICTSAATQRLFPLSNCLINWKKTHKALPQGRAVCSDVEYLLALSPDWKKAVFNYDLWPDRMSSILDFSAV